MNHLLWMSLLLAPSSFAGGLRPAEVVAEVSVEEGERTEEVVLTLHKQWRRRALGDDPSRHVNAVTTMLEPKPVGGDDTLYWLVGYGLEAHEQPGDTRVTYSLLVQVPAAGDDVRALWWEDHMQVPTSLFSGSGALTAGEVVRELKLSLGDVAYGDELVVTGAIRGLSN